MELDLKNVTKRFGSTSAVDDVSFTVDSGARLALIGPNGSGKTTLIRLILGLIRGEGDIRVADWEPFSEREELTERIAYVPQIAPETAMTVEQYTQTVCHARGIEPQQIYDLTESLYFDASEHRHKAYRDLSGGMKQKLLIAMALSSDPDLLVMDEPTASLDADARHRFFELCSKLSEDTTLILCSHRLEEIRHLIDRIVALEDGAVKETGAVEDFMARQGRVAIELKLSGVDSPDSGWLESQDFERLSSGRYIGFFPRQEKMSKLSKLQEKLDADIEDLIVNDLQDLQVDGSMHSTEEQT